MTDQEQGAEKLKPPKPPKHKAYRRARPSHPYGHSGYLHYDHVDRACAELLHREGADMEWLKERYGEGQDVATLIKLHSGKAWVMAHYQSLRDPEYAKLVRVRLAGPQPPALVAALRNLGSVVATSLINLLQRAKERLKR